MSGLKKMTPLPPGPVAGASADARTNKRGLKFVELQDEGIDAPRTLDVRVLPPTSQIQQQIRGKSTRRAAFSAEDVDFDHAEQEAWGHSSRMVKKMPEDASVDDADEYRSAVVSDDKEIISQG